MNFTFRQLEVFLAVARYQNLTRAASALSMSQSAASTALKELEQKFDIQLFDRRGKRLQINDFGRLVRIKAEALIDQAEDFQSILAQHHQVGDLRVGATLTIGNYMAVEVMAAFKQKFPHAQIALQVANTQTIAQLVLDFAIDIGLIEGEWQDAELHITPWREDELQVFCAPSHPYAGLQSLTDENLQEAKWIVREPGSGTRQTFDRAMSGILSSLDIVLQLQHTEAIKRAVEARLGIGCLSQVALKEAFKRGTLVPLAVPQRNFKRKFYFVVHRHKFRTSAIDEWISLCSERWNIDV
ncbi:MAG TPA: LysR family transcriptional regulator [Gammaproteobacteria bacterium]|nr:LysR family transcriptional regulator [Gammaproteobacteria bacterium]